MYHGIYYGIYFDMYHVINDTIFHAMYHGIFYAIYHAMIHTMLYTMLYVDNTISLFSVFSCRTQQHPCNSPCAKQRWGTSEDTNNSSMGM
jgi:hypothetical protein